MKNVLDELWVEIEGYTNYVVSNYGEIVNSNTNRALSAKPDSKGYPKINLCYNGLKDTRYVHRLVAEAFLADYDEHFEVEHIDENKTDCSVRNLRVGKKKARRSNRVNTLLSV